MIVLQSECWREYKLEEVARIEGGGTPSRQNGAFFGGDTPWVTPRDLPPIGSIRILGSVAGSLTDAGLANSSAKLIPENAVLFSSRASIGKIAVTDRACTTNQGFANFIPDTTRIETWFLAYLLAHHTADFVNLAGKTTFLEVSRGKLRAFHVRIPPLDEQRRIVVRIKECMERVDEIERLRAEALAEAEAALPSTLSEIFDQLGAQYGSTTIGDVATETRYGTSHKCDKRAGGVPILRIPNVAAGVINYSDLKYCPIDGSELARIRLVDGDLLFVRTNGSRDLVGRCAVYRPRGADHEFGFASYLIRVRLNADLADPDYLKFFLNSTHGRDEIDRRRRTSAGQFNVNSENLRSISFPCPPKETQLAVIEQLAEQESRLVQLQAEIASAQAIESGLKEAILRKAFTGEL